MAGGWQRFTAALAQALRTAVLAPCLVLCLCLSLLLTACSGEGSAISGNYVEDTVSVADALLSTLGVAADDPGRSDSETQARALINSYMARYRPRHDVNGLASFTTMQTALNSLAGHYANYPNRQVPDALRDRLTKELKKAETGAVRGA